MLGWIIAGAVVLFFVVAFVVDGKREDQWGMPASHLEGIEGYKYDDYIGVSIKRNEKHLRLKDLKDQRIILPFSQIVQVNFITWEKTITKALNPLAEGIVGGIIGGETMAVVSAIDAQGRTRAEKVKVENALEIQYHPKGDYRTIKSIIVRSGLTRNDTVKWANTLCRCANLPAPQYITPQPKGPTYL